MIKRPKISEDSKRIEALTLHTCRRLDFYSPEVDSISDKFEEVNEDQDKIFIELRSQHNIRYSPSEAIIHGKNKGGYGAKKRPHKKESSKKEVGEKENYDDLKEQIYMKKKELFGKSAFSQVNQQSSTTHRQ